MRKPAAYLALVLFSAASLPTVAQMPCDSLQDQGFSFAGMGNYQYEFSWDTESSGYTADYHEWAFLGEDFMWHAYGPAPTVSFPGPATYVACVQAGLWSETGGYCEAFHCELVPVPVDPACAGLVADFSISLEGGSIRFHDLSSAPFPIEGLAWDLGDGSFSDEGSPLHDYPGSGPYKACLTVTGGGCSSTACNWIYTGAPDVPCGTLLQPAIDVIQYDRAVAAFDHSITSGMNTSLMWDFGDGTSASGNPVVHVYDEHGAYLVCGTTDLWGPLTPDTCTASACSWVVTMGTMGTGPETGPPVSKAWPIPFSNELSVTYGDGYSRWEVVDLWGITRLHGRLDGGGNLLIPGTPLPPGTYLLRLSGHRGTQTLRVVKAP